MLTVLAGSPIPKGPFFPLFVIVLTVVAGYLPLRAPFSLFVMHLDLLAGYLPPPAGKASFFLSYPVNVLTRGPRGGRAGSLVTPHTFLPLSSINDYLVCRVWAPAGRTNWENHWVSTFCLIYPKRSI